jgi:hypothetical protein
MQLQKITVKSDRKKSIIRKIILTGRKYSKRSPERRGRKSLRKGALFRGPGCAIFLKSIINA